MPLIETVTIGAISIVPGVVPFRRTSASGPYLLTFTINAPMDEPVIVIDMHINLDSRKVVVTI